MVPAGAAESFFYRLGGPGGGQLPEPAEAGDQSLPNRVVADRVRKGCEGRLRRERKSEAGLLKLRGSDK